MKHVEEGVGAQARSPAVPDAAGSREAWLRLPMDRGARGDADPDSHPLLHLRGRADGIRHGAAPVRARKPLLAVLVAGLLASDVLLPVPSSLVSSFAGHMLGFTIGLLAVWSGMMLGCLVGYWIGASGGAPSSARSWETGSWHARTGLRPATALRARRGAGGARSCGSKRGLRGRGPFPVRPLPHRNRPFQSRHRRGLCGHRRIFLRRRFFSLGICRSDRGARRGDGNRAICDPVM